MSELIYDPKRLPRTMTKAEWAEAYRWLRIVSRKVREEMDRLMINAMFCGTSWGRL